MAKTTQKREQELERGSAWMLTNVWESKTSKVRKDLDAAMYANIAKVAKRYDDALGRFIFGVNKKDRAKDGFAKLWDDLRPMDRQIEDLAKTIGTLHAESFTTVKAKSGDTVDDIYDGWEEMHKRAQGATKEFKAYFERFNKLNETYGKMIADTLAAARSQLDTVNGDLNGANNDLNALESQFRNLVIAAEGAAVRQNKPDVARAVKDVLRVFSM